MGLVYFDYIFTEKNGAQGDLIWGGGRIIRDSDIMLLKGGKGVCVHNDALMAEAPTHIHVKGDDTTYWLATPMGKISDAFANRRAGNGRLKRARALDFTHITAGENEAPSHTRIRVAAHEILSISDHHDPYSGLGEKAVLKLINGASYLLPETTEEITLRARGAILPLTKKIAWTPQLEAL